MEVEEVEVEEEDQINSKHRDRVEVEVEEVVSEDTKIQQAGPVPQHTGCIGLENVR